MTMYEVILLQPYTRTAILPVWFSSLGINSHASELYLSRNKRKYNYSYDIMHIMSFPASYIQQFLSNRLPLVFQRKEKHPNYQARLIQMFNPQLLSPAVHRLQPRHSLLPPLPLSPLPLPDKPPRPSAPVRLSPRTLTSRVVNHPATVTFRPRGICSPWPFEMGATRCRPVRGERVWMRGEEGEAGGTGGMGSRCAF